MPSVAVSLCVLHVIKLLYYPGVTFSLQYRDLKSGLVSTYLSWPKFSDEALVLQSFYISFMNEQFINGTFRIRGDRRNYLCGSRTPKGIITE